jgi:hypothetical protein
MRFWPGTVIVSVLAFPLAACDTGDSNPGVGPTPVADCTNTQATAPNGYWVDGNTVCTPDAKPHLFHGVDRPSMEWSATGENLSLRDFKLMGDGNYPDDPTVAPAAWHANIVRVALNQDWWLQDDTSGNVNPNYAPGYAALVDQVVKWAEEADLDVMLDLHWSDTGNFAVKANQQDMADLHSLLFWEQVSARYQNDGRVLFELYNEPNTVTAEVWLHGGPFTNGTTSYTVVGMQQLYDAIRATGANNLVVVGGLDWAYDLSFVSSLPVVGYNILYATHPYNNSPEREPSDWDDYWGDLTTTKPVIVTEFGDESGACDPKWDETLIPYADRHNASWTAWAWYPGGCQFPSLIVDWTGTPDAPGTVVKKALLGYKNDTAALPARPMPPQPDAGPDASPPDASPPDASPPDASPGVEDGGVDGGMEAGIDGGVDGGVEADAAADADGDDGGSVTTSDAGNAGDAGTPGDGG